MSKTIEEIKEEVAIDHGWRSYNDALDNTNVGVISGYSFADIWEDITERYAKVQTQELQEQNAELVDLVERCRDVIYAYNDYKPTETGNEILQAIQEILTKHNHLKSDTNG